MNRLTITVSETVCDEIAAFSKRHGISRTEAMRRILSVVKIANEESLKGNCLGIIDTRGDCSVPVAKIVGI